MTELKAKEIYLPKLEQKYDFNDEFNALCRVLKKRVREDYDCVIACTGEEGISKSTCLNQLGFKVDKNYSLETHVLYSPTKKEIYDKVRNLPRFSFINADEAMKILYKLLWHSPMQIFLNVFYRLCRQENKISGLSMPRFYEFNEGFRNHRIKIWVHIIDRGMGVVFMKDWSPWAKDPWWFDENQRIIDKYRRGRKLHEFRLKDKIKVFQKSKNFWGVITFPDLPEELRIKYKQLSARYKYEGLEEQYEAQERFSKYTKFYHKTLRLAINEIKRKEPALSNRELARRLKISHGLINKILKMDTDMDIVE